MGKSIQLGKIFGIPFRLDYSWFLIFFFITALLSLSVFPDNHPEWPTAFYWIVGIVTSLVFFASVLAHELAHSLVGRRVGIPAKSITLFFFGGVAHIGKEASRPTTELAMAVAGPLCSIALAGLFYLIAWLTSDLNQYVSAVCAWLALINGMLAIFNMIPGFPLDGGRVLRSIIWLTTGDFMRATRAATMAGHGVSFLFIAGGIIILFTMYWLNGLWLIFIGFFLNSATRATYNQTKLRDTLKGFTAEDVMTRDFPRIPRQLTIRELVNGPLLTSSSHYLLVTDRDIVNGLLTMQQVKEVPRENWDLTTAGQAMAPLEKLKMVRPSDDAISILERIEEDNLEIVAVVREGRLIGMVLRDNLVRFAQRLSELKK